MNTLVILFTVVAAVSAVPTRQESRIVGGTLTTIDQYPEVVAMLAKWSPTWFMQDCGGTILNDHAILTAAHCVHGDHESDWRIRVGSSFASSGGVVHHVRHIFIHPDFDRPSLESDVAVLRLKKPIVFNNEARPGRFSGAHYSLGDDEVVWAAGWGKTNFVGTSSEQLRHVQIWTVNQEICAERYALQGHVVSDTMLCAGWLDVGGRDQCGGDSGGPLFHNGVVVGVTSWGRQCGLARYPGVNARVSKFVHWINKHAMPH